MEMNWVAGEFDVKCYAQEGHDGSWEGRVLIGDATSGTRHERFQEIAGALPTEVEAVAAAEKWARRQMPEDRDAA